MDNFKLKIGTAPSTTTPYLRTVVKSYFSTRVSYTVYSDHWCEISMYYGTGGLTVDPYSYANVPWEPPVPLKYIVGCVAMPTNTGFTTTWFTDAEGKIYLRIFNFTGDTRVSNNIRLFASGYAL